MVFYRYKTEIRPINSTIDSEGWDSHIFTHTELKLDVYVMIRETPAGYWIIKEHFKNHNFELEYNKNLLKWIPKVSKKRFAYPTKEEAAINYTKRTEKYLKILKGNVNSCEVG